MSDSIIIEETLIRMNDALRAILRVLEQQNKLLERQEHTLRKIERELEPKVLHSSGAVVTTIG